MFTNDPDLILFDTEQEAREYYLTTDPKKKIELNLFRNKGEVERVKTPTLLTKDERIYVLPNFGIYSGNKPLNKESEPESDVITSMRCHSVASNGYLILEYQTESGRSFTLNEEKGLQASTSFEDVSNNGQGGRIFFSAKALAAFLNNSRYDKSKEVAVCIRFEKAVNLLVQKYAVTAEVQ